MGGDLAHISKDVTKYGGDAKETQGCEKTSQTGTPQMYLDGWKQIAWCIGWEFDMHMPSGKMHFEFRLIWKEFIWPKNRIGFWLALESCIPLKEMFPPGFLVVIKWCVGGDVYVKWKADCPQITGFTLNGRAYKNFRL